MNIIICGGGQVGYNLAKYLTSRGHDVTLIDTNKKLIDEVNQKLDVKAIFGYGSHPEILQRADAENADIIIATTQIDEINMVICEVAHALFKIPIKIARIRSKSYLQLQNSNLFDENNLSVDITISPEGEVAQSLIHTFKFPGVFNAVPFLNDTVYLLGLRLQSQSIFLNAPICKRSWKMEPPRSSELEPFWLKKYLLF